MKSKSTLAIHGGKPVLPKRLPEVHNLGRGEIAAAVRVIKQGPLSGFLGTASKGFWGGREVLALEKEFAKKFKVKHAISCNSATTGLHMAVVALGIGPGDEVIVPPYSMSASATAILMNGATPIFADIDERTFNIDPASVEKCITPYTKAIMVVNLFGQPADFDALLEIAKKHNLKIIEDNAQGPGAKWRGKYAGTIGDIGVFSFNVHKTMQTGEGGVVVTNNAQYALRAQLCRNHGESVVDNMPDYDAGPIFGSNYRMAEIIAAMARVQLSRLDGLTKKRLALVKHLEMGLKRIPGITLHYVDPRARSVFYRYVLKLDEQMLGIRRDALVDAMAAEGFGMTKGYVKPIYLLPLFQERKAFNKTAFPFESNYYKGKPDYSKGICPVAERLWKEEMTLTDVCQHPYTKKHVDLFLKALSKVLAHKEELQ
jgi:dTDP-4-amino-4,6-dideoxygalactose transaminase